MHIPLAIEDLPVPDAHSQGSAPYALPHWIAWQLADSALPAGGFVHSGGLEACCRLGHVRGADELHDYLSAQMLQWSRGVGPIAMIAFRDPARSLEADELCDLLLNHPTANRASRMQGRGLMKAAKSIFAAELAEPKPAHLAPVLGAVCHRLHLDEPATAGLFLFTHLRNLLASAVRIGIVGPIAAGAMQHRLLLSAAGHVATALQTPPNEIAQTSPITEIFATNHNRLYSRLFQS